MSYYASCIKFKGWFLKYGWYTNEIISDLLQNIEKLESSY